MTRKFALIIYLAGIMILTAGLSLWTSSTAHAQCDDTPQKSSCIACHEKEVSGLSKWRMARYPCS